jgi:hypothetical protein
MLLRGVMTCSLHKTSARKNDVLINHKAMNENPYEFKLDTDLRLKMKCLRNTKFKWPMLSSAANVTGKYWPKYEKPNDLLKAQESNIRKGNDKLGRLAIEQIIVR